MPAGAVGTCWAAGAWPDTTWEAGAWADGAVVVRLPANIIVASVALDRVERAVESGDPLRTIVSGMPLRTVTFDG